MRKDLRTVHDLTPQQPLPKLKPLKKSGSQLSGYTNQSKASKGGRGKKNNKKPHRKRTNASLAPIDYDNLITYRCNDILTPTAYNILALHTLNALLNQYPQLLDELTAHLSYTYTNHLYNNDIKRFLSAQQDTKIILDSILRSRTKETSAPNFADDVKIELPSDYDALKEQTLKMLEGTQNIVLTNTRYQKELINKNNVIREHKLKIFELKRELEQAKENTSNTPVYIDDYIHIDEYEALKSEKERFEGRLNEMVSKDAYERLESLYDTQKQYVSSLIDEKNSLADALASAKSGSQLYREEYEKVKIELETLKAQIAKDTYKNGTETIVVSKEQLKRREQQAMHNIVVTAIESGAYFLFQRQKGRYYQMHKIEGFERTQKRTENGEVMYRIKFKDGNKTMSSELSLNVLHSRIVDGNCIPIDLNDAVVIGKNIKNGYCIVKSKVTSAYTSGIAQQFEAGLPTLIAYAKYEKKTAAEIEFIKLCYTAIVK